MRQSRHGVERQGKCLRWSIAKSGGSKYNESGSRHYPHQHRQDQTEDDSLTRWRGTIQLAGLDRYDQILDAVRNLYCPFQRPTPLPPAVAHPPPAACAPLPETQASPPRTPRAEATWHAP